MRASKWPLPRWQQHFQGQTLDKIEELGPHQGLKEGTEDWSSEGPEKEQEATGACQGGITPSSPQTKILNKRRQSWHSGEIQRYSCWHPESDLGSGLHLSALSLQWDMHWEAVTVLGNGLLSLRQRTCRVGETDSGWIRLACTWASCLGLVDTGCPAGRSGTEIPPSSAGVPCLKVNPMRAA